MALDLVDPMLGLMAWLLVDGEIAALTERRVYGEELPPEQSDFMPRKCVVLRYAGMAAPAPEAGSEAEFSSYRIDAFSYAETPFEASRLRLAVFARFKSISRSLIARVLLHSAIREAGPIPVRDASAGWPIKVETWRVIAADRGVE